MSSHEIAEADANLREIVRLRAELAQAHRWARAWKRGMYCRPTAQEYEEVRRQIAVEKAKRTLLARVLRKKVLK